MADRRSTSALVAILLGAACDAPPDPPTLSGTIRVVAGPSTLAPGGATGSRPGYWLVTPDALGLLLTTVAMSEEGGTSIALAHTTCSVTLTENAATGDTVAECAFSIDADLPNGTLADYDQILVTFSPTYSVIVNDSAHSLYSDPKSPSLLSTIAPTGGGAPVTLGVDADPTIEIGPDVLATPGFEDGEVITVAVSRLQFLRVTITEGGASFGWPGLEYPGIPSMAASDADFSEMKRYVRDEIGTASSYQVDQLAHPGVAMVDVYANAAGRMSVATDLDGPPGGCAPFDSIFVDERGYPGRDASGVLGWAVPPSASWIGYAAELSMPDVSQLGQAADLRCKRIAADPRPPGGSFASGAPVITSPDYEASMILAAH